MKSWADFWTLVALVMLIGGCVLTIATDARHNWTAILAVASVWPMAFAARARA